MIGQITAFIFVLFFCTTGWAQSAIFYQLEVENKDLPYYLVIQDSAFYFFEYKNQAPILCNYGSYKLKEDIPKFEPTITAEGYTLTWSYYTQDSVLQCTDVEPVVATENETKLSPLAALNCIHNIAKLDPNATFQKGICELMTFEVGDKIYTNRSRLDLSQSTDFVTIQPTEKFQVQEQAVPIKSPIIALQDTAIPPKLILTKIVYPRQSHPYHYYFFPTAQTWFWSADQQNLTADCISILTFFDFEKGSFRENFGSKHGVYTACQWSFHQTSTLASQEVDFLEELGRQIEVLDYQKLPLLSPCLSSDTSIILRKYPNPPVQDLKLVQKNSRRQIRRAKVSR